MRGIKAFLQGAINVFGWQALHRQRGGYDLRRIARFGTDHLKDARKILQGRIETVFDIGGNVGQTVRAFLPAFPNARIYSFEPDPGTFEQLQAAVKGEPRVSAVCAALGREPGNAQLHRFRMDQTNSLLPKAVGAEQYVYDKEYLEAAGVISVPVSTVADFCQQQGIARIDVLKIDTQGYELEVLNGARQLLTSGSISLIYLEVCFVPYYEGQPLFQDIYKFLYESGYRLVGLYESGFLTHCYQVGGNALFVHEALGALPPPVARIDLGVVRLCW